MNGAVARTRRSIVVPYLANERANPEKEVATFRPLKRNEIFGWWLLSDEFSIMKPLAQFACYCAPHGKAS